MDKDLIGQRLRQLRLERGLKQADVARQLSISPAYLNLIEKGKRAIQFPLLWKALQYFGQDLEAFMGTLGARRPDDALAHMLDDPLAATLNLDEDDIAALKAEPKAATTIAAAAVASSHFTISIRRDRRGTNRSASIDCAFNSARGLNRATERSDRATHASAVTTPAAAPMPSDAHERCNDNLVVPTAPTHHVRSPSIMRLP